MCMRGWQRSMRGWVTFRHARSLRKRHLMSTVTITTKGRWVTYRIDWIDDMNIDTTSWLIEQNNKIIIVRFHIGIYLTTTSSNLTICWLSSCATRPSPFQSQSMPIYLLTSSTLSVRPSAVPYLSISSPLRSNSSNDCFPILFPSAVSSVIVFPFTFFPLYHRSYPSFPTLLTFPWWMMIYCWLGCWWWVFVVGAWVSWW